MQRDAKRIEPAQLRRLVDESRVTVLDMRRGYESSPDKIPGAIRVDPDAYEGWAGALPRERDVVTYCT
jgi:predicted sulfurtransferase